MARNTINITEATVAAGPCHRLQYINVAEIVLAEFPLLGATSTRSELRFHAVPPTTSGAPLSEVARAFRHTDTRSKLSTALTADEHRIFVTLAHDHPNLFPIDFRMLTAALGASPGTITCPGIVGYQNQSDSSTEQHLHITLLSAFDCRFDENIPRVPANLVARPLITRLSRRHLLTVSSKPRNDRPGGDQ